MTQPEAVLDFMKWHGSITQAQANFELGVSRLAAIIKVLKKRGIEIDCEWQTGVNRYGELTRYKKYWIA